MSSKDLFAAMIDTSNDASIRIDAYTNLLALIPPNGSFGSLVAAYGTPNLEREYLEKRYAPLSDLALDAIMEARVAYEGIKLGDRKALELIEGIVEESDPIGAAHDMLFFGSPSSGYGILATSREVADLERRYSALAPLTEEILDTIMEARVMYEAIRFGANTADNLKELLAQENLESGVLINAEDAANKSNNTLNALAQRRIKAAVAAAGKNPGKWADAASLIDDQRFDQQSLN